MKPDISDAIVALGFDGGFKIKENKIAVWYRDDTQPTQSTIDTKLASMISDWEAQEYARNRQYPELGEQLDLLFHDMTAGKGTKDGEWYKAVAKVKTDNPKPTE